MNIDIIFNSIGLFFTNIINSGAMEWIFKYIFTGDNALTMFNNVGGSGIMMFVMKITTSTLMLGFGYYLGTREVKRIKQEESKRMALDEKFDKLDEKINNINDKITIIETSSEKVSNNISRISEDIDTIYTFMDPREE